MNPFPIPFRRELTRALACAACLGTLGAQATAPAGASYREIDYATLDRSIVAEPDYAAEPRYALFVFGHAGEARMWAVLDKSDPALDHYDVLYFDRDADGDLTDDGERIAGRYDEGRAKAGMAVTLRIGELAVPGTDLVHTDFVICTVPKSGRRGVWFRLKWNGGTTVSGGYGATGMDTTAWATSPAAAPVLRPDPNGPLSFGTWGDDRIEMKIGGATHVNVIAGNRGSGPDTLAVVDEDFIDLLLDELRVTVIARRADGGEVRTISRITEHC
ncbi:MAG: hypothetical protein IPM29_16945 [Planctomycetes bacterium]|nr:hypothetical protein [Planctomycetota bacterium]